MQTIPTRGTAASRVRSAGLSVAIVAAASIVATSSLFIPNPALAACGGGSHTAGVHTATGSGGTHATTGIAASGASRGGGGSLGCANGSSAAGLRALPTVASGRVVEAGAARAARRETHARTAPARTTNAAAHLHTVKPTHRG